MALPPDAIDTIMMQRLVKWRDLTPMRPRDGLIECAHLLPWLAASWFLADQGHWLAALPCSFMFFLTALRLNHEAIHHNLGFNARDHRLVLHILSALMTGSNNAVAANHMHHHQHVMQPDDLEGKAGRMNGWRVLIYGPVFPVEMHIAAWQRGGESFRRRMAIDGLLNFGLFATFAMTGWKVLGYHIAVVIVAQCLTAFFAVWITHQGCEGDNLIARTQRGRLVNLLSYNMFFHLEHHLFPGVPVKRLGTLAARMDAARPQLAARVKMVVPLQIRSAK